MQKARQQVEQKAEKEQFSNDTKQQYIIHQSYYSCERLKFGRLSFKGMNPEIEILMKKEEDCHDDSLE